MFPEWNDAWAFVCVSFNSFNLLISLSLYILINHYRNAAICPLIVLPLYFLEILFNYFSLSRVCCVTGISAVKSDAVKLMRSVVTMHQRRLLVCKQH